MNERLVELYKQATKTAYETVGVEHAKTSYFQGIVAGMFAELIVKECASIVEGSPWNLPRGYKAVDQAELVKKHFGVE